MSNELQKEFTIEERFGSMSEVEHILSRSGMYIGNIWNEPITTNLYKPSENRIIPVENVMYSAGLTKIVDEVLSNSIDERRRKTRLFDIDEIYVFIGTDGKVIIRDNGGIPVQIHKTSGMYLSRFLFGQLRTSGNYNQELERTGVGLNGIGCKIANIFSSRFECQTADGKNKITTVWTNNMQNVESEVVETAKNGEHYTQFTFNIELSRFEREEIDLHFFRLIQKRCIDAAAANLGLKVTFECGFQDSEGNYPLNSVWQFHNFDEFVKLHFSKEDLEKIQILHQYGTDEFIVCRNIGFDSFGFVNGAVCSKGTHIDKIYKQISVQLLDDLKSKNIELITEKDIKSKITIFCNVSIANPNYDSQTKTNLTVKLSTDKLRLSKQFIKELSNSQILQDLEDYYTIKYAAELKKQTRKLNALIKGTKSNKLIACANKNAKDKQLFIFEGTSASEGFRKFRNPQKHEAYLLRGKILNSLNLTREKLLENQEIRELIACLKLQFDDPNGNIKNCPFDKISIASDMDVDGSHIAGLLITFFATYFPEIIKSGKLTRLISPIISAKKDKKSINYYDLKDFEKDMKDGLLKGYEIHYFKGLGSLTDEEYDEMINNQKLIQFELGKSYKEIIKIWFDKDTEMRKQILLEDTNGTENTNN